MAKKKQTSSEQVAAAEVVATPKGHTARRIKRNSRSKRIIPRSTRGYALWRHGPAMVKLLKLPQLALLEVAEQRGLEVREIYDLKYVRASMPEGSAEVHIYPTHEKDPDRIEVVQNSSGFWVNLITLLHDTGWLLPPGYREKHPVLVAGAEGPDGPAVYFNLTTVLERRGPGEDDKDEKKTEQRGQAQQPAAQAAPQQESEPEAGTEETK